MVQKKKVRPGSSYENLPAPVVDTLEQLHHLLVYIETYGCRYNIGDTAKLVEVLKHQGSSLVN